jgi:hypothetical protein
MSAAKKIAIMQPYFLPYIGYFQLISAVDSFVIYDQIKYTKKGWINRNRLLQNGEATTFSLPLAKASDYLDINERQISESFEPAKFVAKIRGAYAGAPQRDAVMELVGEMCAFPDRNLFNFIQHSLKLCCDYLAIKTPLVVSSDVETNSRLNGQERVIGLCKDMNADRYVNPIGGTQLYQSEAFKEHGIRLNFLQPELVPYDQGSAEFVPGLSILDVMMHNEVGVIQDHLLTRFELLDGSSEVGATPQE